MNFSIIIPCYNEEKIIVATLTKLLHYLAENYPSNDIEVLLINDGSRDRTEALVKEFAENHPLINIHSFKYNQGRGAAVIKGLSMAKQDYVLVLDADLSYDTFHIRQILDIFVGEPSVDCVVVSPYAAGGKVRNVPWMRHFISRMANRILSRSFSLELTTVTSVVRGYKRQSYRGIQFIERGKELHLEILRNLDLVGAKIVEIPGVLEWKDKSRSGRLKWGQIFTTTRKHLLYGLLNRPTRFLKFLTVGTLFVGVYESILLAVHLIRNFEWVDEGFGRSLWFALAKTLQASPHTVILAAVGLILGFQALAFLVTLKLLTLQQRELLAHSLKLQQRLADREE